MRRTNILLFCLLGFGCGGRTDGSDDEWGPSGGGEGGTVIHGTGGNSSRNSTVRGIGGGSMVRYGGGYGGYTVRPLSIPAYGGYPSVTTAIVVVPPRRSSLGGATGVVTAVDFR
jgi:hypothetical protein